MFRKAAIVLALAASFLGAQAMDLPKPVRELTHKNKTKPTAHNAGVKSKAKTVDLCIKKEAVDEGPVNGGHLAIIGATVYDCADVKTDGTGLIGTPTGLGVLGATCAATGVTANDLSQCTSQLTLNTEWHKTTKTSSLAISFWADTDKLDVTQTLTLLNPVVTGTTGAFGKVDNIQSLALAPISTSNDYYKLTLGYKGRGWNPAAY